MESSAYDILFQSIIGRNDSEIIRLINEGIMISDENANELFYEMLENYVTIHFDEDCVILNKYRWPGEILIFSPSEEDRRTLEHNEKIIDGLLKILPLTARNRLTNTYLWYNYDINKFVPKELSGEELFSWFIEVIDEYEEADTKMIQIVRICGYYIRRNAAREYRTFMEKYIKDKSEFSQHFYRYCLTYGAYDCLQVLYEYTSEYSGLSFDIDTFVQIFEDEYNYREYEEYNGNRLVSIIGPIIPEDKICLLSKLPFEAIMKNWYHYVEKVYDKKCADVKVTRELNSIAAKKKMVECRKYTDIIIVAHNE